MSGNHIRVLVKLEMGDSYMPEQPTPGNVCATIARACTRPGRSLTRRFPYPWTDYNIIRDLMLHGY